MFLKGFSSLGYFLTVGLLIPIFFEISVMLIPFYIISFIHIPFLHNLNVN